MIHRLALAWMLASAAATAACSSSDQAGASGSSGSAGSPGADGGTAPCTARSCAQSGAACGKAPDGCGGVLDCGDCPAGAVCGGGGVNTCGSSGCVPKACGQAGALCGVVSDGCGDVVDCGECPSPPKAVCDWAAGVTIGTPEAISLPGVTAPSEPFLSFDGKSLFFAEFTSQQRLYVATRPTLADPFGAPTPLDQANAGWYSTQRYVPSRDGMEVFLTAIRNENDDLDLFRARWNASSSAWSDWEPLANVNTSGHENNAVVTWDGLSLYLTRNNGDDLYVARRSSTDQDFGPADLVSELSSPGVQEASPSLTSDELTIVFTRNLDGNVLHFATRKNRTDPFDPPSAVPGAPAKVMWPFVREDGCEFYFALTEPWQLYRAEVIP